MFREQITKIHNMSLFASPWDPRKMAAYMVCETDKKRKLMVLFKALDNHIQINYDMNIGYLGYTETEVELVLQGHSCKEVFTIFDLDTGEGLNGKN